VVENAVPLIHGNRVRRQPRIAPNGVIGMAIFVAVEAMIFAGMFSAFTIVKGSSLAAWPPPGQPRLPVEATAFNTAVLLLSGVLLVLGQRAFRLHPDRAARFVMAAAVCGAGFVGLQGREWYALLREGLTMTSSTHGAFFYLIIGFHGLHAIAAIITLGYAYGLARRGRLSQAVLSTVQIFWYFVVLVWPVLYWRVYL
jgi:heme/copper-type cytochrome/quinol oxidase subunit 3